MRARHPERPVRNEVPVGGEQAECRVDRLRDPGPARSLPIGAEYRLAVVADAGATSEAAIGSGARSCEPESPCGCRTGGRAASSSAVLSFSRCAPGRQEPIRAPSANGSATGGMPAAREPASAAKGVVSAPSTGRCSAAATSFSLSRAAARRSATPSPSYLKLRMLAIARCPGRRRLLAARLWSFWPTPARSSWSCTTLSAAIFSATKRMYSRRAPRARRCLRSFAACPRRGLAWTVGCDRSPERLVGISGRLRSPSPDGGDDRR